MSEPTLHIVSLGCPKNRVDSEVMLGVAQQHGYVHTTDPAAADVIVVNTCGFIDPAKKESIDTILALAEHRSEGRCRKLVVTGCLSQRHPEELATGLPEVDHFLGSSDMLRLGEVLDGGAERMLVGQPADWLVAADSPRTLSLNPGSAYVKIAEGCNRQCSFCVIPELRGKQRSRTVGDVVREVEQLAARGVMEINLISQDTISYGRDLPTASRVDLAQLVERVADVAGVRWLRLFYLYPETLSDALVELLAQHPTVVPYVDMPLQHACDDMLRRMRRGHGGQRLRDLVQRLRTRIDNLTFRTAFIVGHPGEREADFDALCEFVQWAQFDRVGVFRYSDEEGCHSHDLPDKIDETVARRRQQQLQALARRIARDNNAGYIDQTMEVLVEGASDEHEHVQMGRHAGQAPEIDGQVYLSGTERLPRPPRAGEMLKVRITQSSDFDLAGEVIGEGTTAAHAPNAVRLTVLGADNRAVR